MLPTLLLIFFLPFIASDDFDEITHRKFKAIKISEDRLKELVSLVMQEDDLGTVMFVQCDRIDYLHNLKSFLRRYNFLSARIPNAKLVDDIVNERSGKLLHTTSLYAEFQGDDFHFLFSFWQFEVEGPWKIYRIEDLTCNLPQRRFIQEVVEMTQKLRYTEGKLAKNVLKRLFIRESWFKFCDEVADPYFFYPKDSLSQEPVIIHNLVHFNRYTIRDPQITMMGVYGAEVAYYQMHVSVNGRRMLVEYDDDLKKFTKGREYPCERDIIHNIKD